VKPVLLHLGGVDRDPALATTLTLAGLVAGFAGAKVNYLLENAGHLSWSDLGGTGFTWYGGMLAGAAAVLFVARRNGIRPALIAGITAAPLAFAYAIGRIGCLLAGDGTYGKPSDLPWAMSFPHGTVPTLERVHPTPLYEAIAAFALGLWLWRLRTRLSPERLFAVFAISMGAMRFLIEFLRLNSHVFLGLTEAQLWSLGLVLLGLALARRRSAQAQPPAPLPTPTAPLVSNRASPNLRA